MKELTLAALILDKREIEQTIKQMQKQLLRLDGILGYLNDNIAELEKGEKEDINAGS